MIRTKRMIDCMSSDLVAVYPGLGSQTHGRARLTRWARIAPEPATTNDPERT